MPARLDLREIERRLGECREELAREYGVSRLGVFGSYVRGEARDDSDVDILVEFNRPIGFFRFLELEARLSEILGANVDLVSRNALKPHIGQHILREVTML